MNDLIDTILDHIQPDIFSDQELHSLLKRSPHGMYGTIKRALASGKLIHIRRGLYCLAKKYQRKGIDLFEMAQLIYGPSYISLESALSYHQWIPEAVYSVTSACTKRSREYRTPLGPFIYFHLPLENFYTGVERIQDERRVFFIASPLKALVDYVFAMKKDWKSITPVIESLRIEEDKLHAADTSFLAELQESYHNKRVEKFVRGIARDLSA